MSFEFSNTCTCTMYSCNDCGESFVNDADDKQNCPHCGSEDITDEGPFYDCDCATINQNHAAELWDTWKNLNPAPYEWYIINGESMGWQNRSGTRGIEEDQEPYDVIQVNSEWTQTWPEAEDYAAGEPLTIGLSHHDSPTGETYTITPATFEQALYALAQSPDHEDTWIGDVNDFLARYFTPGDIDEQRFREIADDLYFEADDYL